MAATESDDLVLGDGDFRRLQAMIRELAGISFGESKRAMVVSRLGKRVRATGARDFGAYLDRVARDRTGAERQAFVNALTTNLTRFFREPHHFDRLAEHVGALVAAGTTRRLRVWSAGCSSGQEPYSIALSLLRRFPELAEWDFRVLATDIDTDILAQAATGTYPAEEAAALEREQRWGLDPVGGDRVRVMEAARRLVSFRMLNIHAEWPMHGPFDAIFCRNVAIYFDRATQSRLFARLGDKLTPGGLLFIGHSETLGSGQGDLALVGETTYRRRDARKEAA